MTPDNPSTDTCPTCGAELGSAPAGLCPRCLMRSAMATSGTAGPTIPDGDGDADLRGLFPEYEIFELLGRGGMGAVYRAQHKNLDRPVALKVLLPNLREDPEFAARFTREARAMARLDHPNVVGVHDFGERDGVFYLVMEFVDGSNLRELIDQGALTSRDVLRIVPQICDALQFAHQRRVVHRDIKPENILIDEDLRVRIADFGLAKLLGGGNEAIVLTRTEQVFGTPQYMAPEQMRMTAEVDHRADIYSLGVVLYEMLTGELPIGHFAVPSAKAGSAKSMDEVVMKSLANQPEARYQSADEVKAGLEDADRTSTRPKRPTPPTSPTRPSTDPSLIGMALAVVVILVASFMPWGTVRSSIGDLAASSWNCKLYELPNWLPAIAALVFAVFYVLRHRDVKIPSQLLAVWTCYGALHCALWISLMTSSDRATPGPGPFISLVAFGYLLYLALPWAKIRRLPTRWRSSSGVSRPIRPLPSQPLWAAGIGFVVILCAMLMPWGHRSFGGQNAFDTNNAMILLYVLIYVSEVITATALQGKKPNFGILLTMASLGFLHSFVSMLVSRSITAGPTLAALTFLVWIVILLRSEPDSASDQRRRARRRRHARLDSDQG